MGDRAVHARACVCVCGGWGSLWLDGRGLGAWEELGG
jgi:hypothetical protein